MHVHRVLQSNKKANDFREVMKKITTERKEKYNVLWADPKASPQVRACLVVLSVLQQQVVSASDANQHINTFQFTHGWWLL